MTSEEAGIEIPSKLDVLVLSPHLDDAALSCGGALHRLVQEQGKAVAVVNVFTADEPSDDALSADAQGLHAAWRRAGSFDGAIMAHRREEERAACQRLGVDVYFFGFEDALYRRDDGGRPLYDPVAQVMGLRHPSDEALLTALEADFQKLPRAATWWLPLGVGHHVDHLLVRQAAERVPDIQRLYYEDYPYARSRWLRLKARWRGGWRQGLSWRRQALPLRAEDLDAKVEAIQCHRSQLDVVYDSVEEMERQVRQFSAGGARLWVQT